MVLTFNEVCKTLKISRPTLLKLIERGRIKGVKIETRWRFDKKEIERFLNDTSREV